MTFSSVINLNLSGRMGRGSRFVSSRFLLAASAPSGRLAHPKPERA
ncbi:MAG TPA: hypothetical protein VFQ35_12265 [Polyangiaceae bacterium]|nr:hypothetical protein [Polyangiaceae bacterium]